MMVKRPLLADVNCSKIQFQPGDQLLVKLLQPLDNDQIVKLRRAVQRWAGKDVEVLIYDATSLEVKVERPNRIISAGI